jgi:hypothetical protein
VRAAADILFPLSSVVFLALVLWWRRETRRLRATCEATGRDFTRLQQINAVMAGDIMGQMARGDAAREALREASQAFLSGLQIQRDACHAERQVMVREYRELRERAGKELAEQAEIIGTLQAELTELRRRRNIARVQGR